MTAKLNLIGQTFGRLTVISEGPKQSGKIRWVCLCSCGKTKVVTRSNLTSGHTQSCGCRQVDSAREMATKHGGSSTRLFRIWSKMRERCSYARGVRWSRYGGRGISVCDEWKEFSSFRDWALSNGYADNLSIDRIDINGNYEPSNCRWVTAKEQARNTSTNAVFGGKCIAEWAEETGIKQGTLRARLCVSKWPLSKAISKPVRR